MTADLPETVGLPNKLFLTLLRTPWAGDILERTSPKARHHEAVGQLMKYETMIPAILGCLGPSALLHVDKVEEPKKAPKNNPWRLYLAITPKACRPWLERPLLRRFDGIVAGGHARQRAGGCKPSTLGSNAAATRWGSRLD